MKNKLIKMMAILAVCSTVGLGFVGCRVNVTPAGLDYYERPLIIVANNDAGLIMRDHKGSIIIYDESFYIAKIALKQNLKPGDVFCP